jgi:hypothetical protein
MKKNPWTAAILSFLFFGGGYIYNGKQSGFGAALVLAWILLRAGEIPIYLTHLVNTQWLILFSGMVVLQFTFAVSAYREAKAINESSKN